MIFKDTYRDSVLLMRLSQELESVDGIQQATVVMGTDNNKALLQDADLLTKSGEGARANDVILAARISTPDKEAVITARALELLTSEKRGENSKTEYRPRSLDGALSISPDANLVVISVPGQYAADEAKKALERGLHVLLFSDNVSVDDEVALKHRALQLNRFMLGPDCGTAIINNVPVGFANVVPKGRVGLVSASGTGLQQVVCLLDAAGEGVSQALGVGSRDLDDRVGGAMTLEGLRTLEEDPQTEVIVLISKPPDLDTGNRVLNAARQCKTPCVVCFLGMEETEKGSPNMFIEPNLESATNRVLRVLEVDTTHPPSIDSATPRNRLEMVGSQLHAGQRRIRGLYSGGTLCYEALVLLRELVDEDLFSNLQLSGVYSLQSHEGSQGHTLVDLGDDLFTVGKPHPMIDLRERCRRIVREAANPEVGVILLDVILGYGAHPDPASEIAQALEEAQRIASDMGRGLACVVVLCGTTGDPQSLAKQREQLAAAGALVVSSNVQAVKIAAALSRGESSQLQGSI